MVIIINVIELVEGPMTLNCSTVTIVLPTGLTMSAISIRIVCKPIPFSSILLKIYYLKNNRGMKLNWQLCIIYYL